MATTEATLYEIKQGAAWITLNRPENRNALSSILVTELYDHIMAANADDAVAHRHYRQWPGFLCGR